MNSGYDIAVQEARGGRDAPPVTVWILCGALLFLAVGAFYGGLSLLRDPSGAQIGLPIELIRDSAFGDYTIPGFILLVLFGFAPVVTIMGLVRRTGWPTFLGYRWPWIAALKIALGLAIWLTVQINVVGYFGGIQTVYIGFTTFLMTLVLLPGVRRHYRVERSR